ncbi:MAG: dihydrolipoyl dehydrogenase [Thermoplasmatota archaeon]
MADYDVIVIGAGPGGYVAAIRAGQLGLKTAVVNDSEVGGVCLNWGCIPSKAIISTGKQVKAAQKGGRGISFGKIAVDMPAVIEHKNGVVKQLTGGVSGLLKGNKVEHIQGRATFTDKNTIKVGAKSLKAKQFIVATGSSTIEIPGFKFDEKRILSSTGALDLQEVPEHLVVIGGGVIGLELAGAYRNLGTKAVTVIEMMDQLVPGTDKEIAKALERSLKKKKFKLNFGARAKEAKASKTGVKVTFEDKKGNATTLDASHVLVSVGRRPNTKDLGLEKAGVKLDERGFVPTDAQGRTNVSHIYAIGDITHGPMLAHKASKEGIVAAEAIAGQKGAAKDWKTIPGVIFTDPEIATAGLSEEQAKEAGHTVKVGKFNVGALGKALADGEAEGFYKVIGDAKTDEVLGIHIIGPHASDLISEAALALEMGATVEDIGLTVHPHPTLGEGLMEAAEALHGKAVHAMNR